MVGRAEVGLSADTALVLFSGGQDSTVCLAWALERFARVETIGFAYGQRHAVELEVRPRIRAKLAAFNKAWGRGLGDDHVVTLDALAAISDTALTRDVAIRIAENGLPTTFVPGRNLIFLSFAGALAYRRGGSTSSLGCARPTIPAIPTAATTPSRPCRSRSASAWTAGSSSIRR
jgi:7-cyano-7-deazaguanine synthase